MTNASAFRAPVQRAIHRRENLIDGDLVVVVDVARQTGRYIRVPERDVHHGEDLIHGHDVIAVAISRAGEHRG